MADSILELAAEAASSTLFIFCIFNLILLIILFTSRPVSSSSDHQNHDDVPLSIVIHSNTNAQQNFMLQKNAIVDVCAVTETLNEPDFSDSVEGSGDDHEDEDEDEDEVEDEEDFKRRVEEFIEKVNSGWREERQRTSRLVE
ncbi:hypothetical protein SDJN03_02985, partial [Cucurbita argyrosperma subsp. sororia]